MKSLIWIFFVFILATIVSADPIINEIMYNPSSGGYDSEYIEIYCESGCNLNNYVIEDINTDDNLTEVKSIISHYSLIVGTGFDYSSINASVYVCENTQIGNGLNNDNDIIVLKDNAGKMLDALSYSDDIGADGNGLSLCKIPDANYLVECTSTPGAENYQLSPDYSVLKITEFLPDPEGYDDAPMPGGEWVELYNSGDSAIDLQGLTLNDNYGDGLNISQINVLNNNTIILPKTYLTIYRNNNGKLELNNDGFDKVILSKESMIIDQVHYTDSSEGNSYAYIEGIGWQNTKPTPGTENIPYDFVEESRLEIIDIYDLGNDDIAKFGQTIRAKVNIYKGDETKTSIKLWIADNEEKISKESRISIYQKFSDNTLTIPIQLKPNCNKAYEDGNYDVFIAWTSEKDEEDTFPIEVEGITDSLCEEIEVLVEKEESNITKKFIYEIISKPTEVEIGSSFESEIYLENNEKNDMDIKIWSYVYKGSKSYSGERELNMKTFKLKVGESKKIKLVNIINASTSPGEYKFKVKINKNNQKIDKEITDSIILTQKSQSCTASTTDTGHYIRYNPITIYESTSAKASKTIPYFMISVFGLLSLLLSLKSMQKNI